jgi:creatinine amidohydrolase/Fe(II)-dependent formamide hydrolase-like protein
VPDAVAQLRREGRDAAWWPCAPAGGDAHAGRTETSLLLALDPAAVRMAAAAPGATAPLVELLSALRSGGVAAVSPNGVLGDPIGANAAEGERLLAEMTAALHSRLTRWRPDTTGRLT